MATFDINQDFRVSWYPKQHITAPDLGDGKGGYKTFVVRGKKIGTEMLIKQKTNKKEPTPVMYLEKGSKYLILTNAICKGFLEATGSALPKDWIKADVELFVEKGVKAFGKTSDQVRVRSVAGRHVEIPEELPDEIDDEFFDEHDEEVVDGTAATDERADASAGGA